MARIIRSFHYSIWLGKLILTKNRLLLEGKKKLVNLHVLYFHVFILLFLICTPPPLHMSSVYKEPRIPISVSRAEAHLATQGWMHRICFSEMPEE